MTSGYPLEQDKVIRSLKRTLSISRTAQELGVGYSSVARINKKLGLIQLNKSGYPIKVSSCLTEPLTSKEVMFRELETIKAENIELREALVKSEKARLKLKESLDICNLKVSKQDETIMRLKLNHSGLEAICGD